MERPGCNAERHDDRVADAEGHGAGRQGAAGPCTDGPDDEVQDGRVHDDRAAADPVTGDERPGGDTAGGQPAHPPTAGDGPAVPGTAGDETTHERDTWATSNGSGLPTGGRCVGHISGLPVTPTAVQALLQQIDAPRPHPPRQRIPGLHHHWPGGTAARRGHSCRTHCRVTNLVMLCRHHHRLKTHAPGWAFRLDPDGTLHVTTPGGATRTTRPPGIDEVLDLMGDPPPVYDPDDDPPPF